MYRLGHGSEETLAGSFIAVEVLIPQLLHAHRRQRRVAEEGVVTVIHHVLEHHHTQLVALVVEFLGLYLNVLAEGVEAQSFHGEDVLGVAVQFERYLIVDTFYQRG